MPRHGKPIIPKDRRPAISAEQVRQALMTVQDPELGASLIDLNMVRKIEINGRVVNVGLVLTAPNCPMAGLIILRAQRAVGALPGVKEVNVELIDEPYQQPTSRNWNEWLERAYQAAARNWPGKK